MTNIFSISLSESILWPTVTYTPSSLPSKPSQEHPQCAFFLIILWKKIRLSIPFSSKSPQLLPNSKAEITLVSIYQISSTSLLGIKFFFSFLILQITRSVRRDIEHISNQQKCTQRHRATYIYYFTLSVGQKFKHNLNKPLVQRSRCQPGIKYS